MEDVEAEMMILWRNARRSMYIGGADPGLPKGLELEGVWRLGMFPHCFLRFSLLSRETDVSSSATLNNENLTYHLHHHEEEEEEDRTFGGYVIARLGDGAWRSGGCTYMSGNDILLAT